MKNLEKLVVFLIMTFCFVPITRAVTMGEILSAETRTGTIAAPSQTDTFTFNGEAGQAVIINISTESGGVDPVIDLYDPDGTLETSAQCGSICSHTLIKEHKLLKSGLYTILLSDYSGNDTGDYSLSLLLIPGPTVSFQDSDGGDILSGETKLGAISLKADTDAYTFDGEAGQTVAISMSTIGGGVDPVIYLYDPDGALEKSASCGSICGYTIINGYQLLESGLYTIVLSDYSGNDTGDYSLSLTKIPASQTSPSIRTILNQDEFTTGETLTVSAHLINGPEPVQVEVKMWITLPDGSNKSIFNSHYTLTVGANADFTKKIFTRTFTGSEPPGDYNVGSRLVNPLTGREISVNVDAFTFTP